MKRLLALALVGLLVAACGGAATVEPTIAPPTDVPSTAVPTVEEIPEEPTDDAAPEPTAESVTEEAPTEEAVAEPESDDETMVGGLAAEGVDPESGLMINPEAYLPGDTFLVRGELVTMNLTPQTEPEFVLLAPSGQRYRISTQPLDEIFLSDGSQIAAFQYRQGMLATATAMLAADAGPADILSSEDFMLLAEE